MTNSSSFRTFNGCQCESDCKLNYLFNCNAAQYCTVSKSCPGAKSSMLYGYYDYCHYKDGTVRGLGASERYASLLANIQRDSNPQAFFGSVEIATGVRGESMLDTMTMEHDVFYYPRKKYVRPV